jgi:gluconolactonase
MIAELNNPMPEFQTIVGNYNGKKLNSPNDAVFSNTGDLYFTDPPYGLVNGADDPSKELEFQGVYRYTKEGDLVLLTKELTRPNGISLSPDETKLFVANSDPEQALWMVYELDDDGNIENGKVFYDATQFVGKEKGLPDGLKVNSKGILFATGPGGVWVFHPDGSHLGTIKTTQATANCALSNDESILYITADSYLLRLKLINL